MSIKDVISPFYAWKRAAEKPYTVMKPLEEREGAQNYRGWHTNDVEKCIGCGSCEEICENEAIDMVKIASIAATKGDSGLRPLVDYGRCCWCALCVDICPTSSLGMSNEYTWVTENPEDYRFIPGVDKKDWDNSEKGYVRGKDAWLVQAERTEMEEIEPDIRRNNFDEFALGFTDEEAFIEAARCLECGICVEACPTHMDIPEYIKAIRENDVEEGFRIMLQTNPMLEACGRICTANCEKVCSVGVNGEAIAIRSLKRYIGDKTYDRKDEISNMTPKPNTGKKIALVGGGPASLTSAFYLRLMGHTPVIFEKHDTLGGMLKYGIPDYRLPADVLQREIDFILRQGVEIKYNTMVGKDIFLEDLHKQYDAVFIGVGAQLGTQMPIEGLDSEGVYSGVEFLEKIAKGERPDMGKKVLVVGGGNTAMDACRSSARLGAEVAVIYRRSEAEMPADPVEIREAKEENIEMQLLATPIKIERKGKQLHIECQKMTLGEPDASGRRRPVPMDGSEYTMVVDSCIMAVGQGVDPKIYKDLDIKLTRWNTYEVNVDTTETNIDNIYSGGDCETGADDAIRAIGSGKRAAYFIDEKLMGKK